MDSIFWDGMSPDVSASTNVSFISHIHVRFLSCVLSFIVLPTLPSPSSTVFLKFPNVFRQLWVASNCNVNVSEKLNVTHGKKKNETSLVLT